MKQQTRDNLIYLAFGLRIAALLFSDALYPVKNDREMWMPSRFAMRAVGSTGVLAWALALRETVLSG